MSTSVSANGTAFGFSIMITVSFGALSTKEGTPTIAELFLFGSLAALAIGALEAIVTRGFRDRVGSVPAEVSMLGTALDVLSVAAGVGAVVAAAAATSGLLAWGLGGFLAAGVYVLAESAEILLAIVIQRRRGDVEADVESPA